MRPFFPQGYLADSQKIVGPLWLSEIADVDQDIETTRYDIRFEIRSCLDLFQLCIPQDPEHRQDLLDGFFALIAANYDSIVDVRRNVHNIRQLFDYLASLICVDSNSKVIDYGCGTGISLRALPAIASRIVGVDSCPAMRGISRRSGMQVWSDESLARQPAGSIDCAFSSYVLHFRPDPHGFYALWSVLRPGGVVVANFHKGMGISEVSTLVTDNNGRVLELPTVESQYNHGPCLAFIKE